MTLASSNIESYSKLKPVSQSDTTIKYGPYANMAPFSESEMVIHAENNNHMLVVTQLLRVIEVSMWGNIAVEETVDVRHNGAVLASPLARTSRLSFPPQRGMYTTGTTLATSPLVT